MRRRARSRQSLGGTYSHPFGAYTPRLADVRVWALARSPLHYEPGDMRGAYDWLRAMVAAALTAWLASLTVRLAVAGAAVTLFAADVWLIAGLNVTLTAGILATAARRRLGPVRIPTPDSVVCFCHWISKRETERL